MSLNTQALPTFTRCADGRFYQDLVYQDFPQRRAWFVCFDENEPAEIVVREDTYREMPPAEILKRRGFDLCLKRILPGRKEVHMRFFRPEQMSPQTDIKLKGHAAISWFLVFKKGIPLPAPNEYDSCFDIFPFHPNKPGVYFGDKR